MSGLFRSAPKSGTSQIRTSIGFLAVGPKCLSRLYIACLKTKRAQNLDHEQAIIIVVVIIIIIIIIITHAFALSVSQFVHKKKSVRIYTSTSMHSGGLELTKLTYSRHEDNLLLYTTGAMQLITRYICY